MAENGILPTRDPDSHALQMGAFLPPNMPGTFNEMIRDVSKRAGTVAGSIAQRDAFPLDKRFPGLCWVAIPDNPTAGDLTVELFYWSGTYWEQPDLRPRVKWVPRSQMDTRADRPIERNIRFEVLSATWLNAPQGDYTIHGDYTIQAAAFSEMLVASSFNGKSVVGDYREDVDNRRVRHQFDGAVVSHPGGNLEVKVWVTMVATSAAIYTAGSALTFSYLGRSHS
ncbi:hypothetical protein C5B92_07025 [Rathayibacter sp. AY1A4]|uniref:hypothetical protein n=1 Tax=Rathayibacter sp. AY1A4 TaxID=2080522 RepID=UPI000CE81AA4|nr:hypothetical protein [Rathayibacter sp. AY1A4]PPF18261.1 hypothetical protein C5B92_07025 [Rathayibacter sp. AY1A4]